MVRSPNSTPEGRGQGVEPGGRDRLIARLVEIQPELRRRFEATMPAHLRELRDSLAAEVGNTTIRQLEVLRILATEGPLAMHRLAELHGITRSSTTELVDRLELHGLVERRHDPLDRRLVEVALTARAEELAARVRRLHQASLTALTGAYDDDELTTLVRLLEKLAGPETPGQLPPGGPEAPGLAAQP